MKREGLSQAAAKPYRRLPRRSIAGCCERLSQGAAKAWRRLLRSPIAGGCEALSQGAAKAYRRVLRKAIAGCREGLAQTAAKPYRRRLRRLIAGCREGLSQASGRRPNRAYPPCIRARVLKACPPSKNYRYNEPYFRRLAASFFLDKPPGFKYAVIQRYCYVNNYSGAGR